MKYKNKLFFSFTCISVLSACTAVLTFYSKTREFVFLQTRSQIYSVGVAYTENLDGDYIQTITSKNSTTTSEYQELVKQLRAFRNINRRPDFYLTYVCIFIKTDQGKYIYIADAEEDPKLISNFGDPFAVAPSERDWDGKSIYVDSKESKDQWGDWIAGLFPIYNSKNEIVAFLELDLNFSSFLKKLYTLTLYALLGFFSSLGLGFFIAYYFSKTFTHAIFLICQAAQEIGKGNFKVLVNLTSKDELEYLATQINIMAKNLEEKERIKTSFGKYVSSHVLEKILKNASTVQIEGEKRKITVLFSDIRHFTTLSEHLPPEKVVNFLNQYFESMIEIIFKYHGTLDKFLGDGIMVEFGAPLEDDKQEQNALLAAIEMQSVLAQLKMHWQDEEYKNIQIGIGIHTGDAIVGNIGSSRRMEYTAIGDTVNVASRLEHLTKELQHEIIISEKTYQIVKDLPNISFTKLGPTAIRGREEMLSIFSVKKKID